MAPELLYTLEEVGKFLHLSRARIYELLSEGKLTAVKIGGSTRVRESVIDAFTEALPAAAIGRHRKQITA